MISQMTKKKIEIDLDLENILKKLYEIDSLKLLLFDDDQLLLFNSFSTPVIQGKNLVDHSYLRQNTLLKLNQARDSGQIKMSFLLKSGSNPFLLSHS